MRVVVKDGLELVPLFSHIVLASCENRDARLERGTRNLFFGRSTASCRVMSQRRGSGATMIEHAVAGKKRMRTPLVKVEMATLGVAGAG